ncbi:MAG: hypothetical protein II416_06510, partial [Prevotella sp.]|nr:hypothetical protein [Prevotella sp.]
YLLSLASRTVTVGSLPPMGLLHSWLLSSDAYGIFHASWDYLTKFYPLQKSTELVIRGLKDQQALSPGQRPGKDVQRDKRAVSAKA